MTEINSFTDEYRFLSNFYLVKIRFNGIIYPSVEHAYQALKTKDKKERIRISKISTPGRAKMAGRGLKLRYNWDLIKVNFMLFLVRRKFQNLDLRQRLIDTGDCQLIEGNNWNDTFWGVCNGKGKNHLGKILMQIRNEIQ